MYICQLRHTFVRYIILHLHRKIYPGAIDPIYIYLYIIQRIFKLLILSLQILHKALPLPHYTYIYYTIIQVTDKPPCFPKHITFTTETETNPTKTAESYLLERNLWRELTHTKKEEESGASLRERTTACTEEDGWVYNASSPRWNQVRLYVMHVSVLYVVSSLSRTGSGRGKFQAGVALIAGRKWKLHAGVWKSVRFWISSFAVK